MYIYVSKNLFLKIEYHLRLKEEEKTGIAINSSLKNLKDNFPDRLEEKLFSCLASQSN